MITIVISVSPSIQEVWAENEDNPKNVIIKIENRLKSFVLLEEILMEFMITGLQVSITFKVQNTKI
tara:strand:+ start:285 stop:482 length:198 start_codon:yes stop_codon:yes gene_type:complete